jgi:hypothetical protein
MKILLFLFSILIVHVNSACVSTTTPFAALVKVCNSGYILKDGSCEPYSFPCQSNSNPNFYNFENGTCTCDYVYNCHASDMNFDPDTCGCTCADSKYLDTNTGRCEHCLGGTCQGIF